MILIIKSMEMVKNIIHQPTDLEYLSYFFGLYAEWDFSTNPVQLDADGTYKMSHREAMALLTPDKPNRNATRNATPHSVQAIKKALAKARKAKSEEELFMDEKCSFFGTEPSSKRMCIKLSVQGLKIDQVEEYGGWLESRIPSFLIRLGLMRTSVYARVLPTRFKSDDKSFPIGWSMYIRITRPSRRRDSIGKSKATPGNSSRKDEKIEDSKDEKVEDVDARKSRRKKNVSPRKSRYNESLSKHDESEHKVSNLICFCYDLRSRSRTPPQLHHDLTAAIQDFQTLVMEEKN
jgi:poly(A) polymerase Pap1